MVQTRPKKIFSQWVVLPGVGIAVVMAATAYPPALVGAVTPGAVLRLLFLFPAVLLLPGYLLDALLRLTGEEVTPAAPAVWLALSCGVLAPAGWAVLALHTSLTSFGWFAAGTLAGLAGLCLLLRAGTRPLAWPFQRKDALGVCAVAVLFLTFLLATSLAPMGGDNWTYNAHLLDYISTDSLAAAHPAYGADVPMTVRMRYNVWLVIQAFLARGTGMDPGYVLMWPFRLLMAAMAIAAAFSLGWAMSHSPRGALWTAGVFLACLFLSAGFRRPGSMVMNNAHYDKYTAAFVLMPAGWYLLLRVLEQATWREWLGLVVLGAGLTAVHAEVLMLLLISCGFLFLSLLALRHPRSALKRAVGAALCLAPWTAFVFVSAWLYMKTGPAPGTPSWELLHQADLAQGRIRFVGGGPLFIVEPSLVLYPVLLFSLLLTPLLLRSTVRRRPSAALLLGNQVGPLLLMLLPGLPNLMAKFTEYNTLWRIGWICMPAYAIAFVLYGEREWLLAQWERVRAGVRMSQPLRWALRCVLTALCLLGLLTAARAAEERDIIGKTGRQWIPAAGLRETLAPIEPFVRALGDPMVLASRYETYQIPSSWPRARVLAMRGVRGTLPAFPPERQEEALARLRLVRTWGESSPLDSDLERALREYQVTLVVLNRGRSSAFQLELDRFPLMFAKVIESPTHAVYLLPAEDSPWGIAAHAQLALARGEDEEACRAFAAAAEAAPGFGPAWAGLGWCTEQAGDTAQAAAYYERTLNLVAGGLTEREPLPAGLSAWAAYEPHSFHLWTKTLAGGTAGFAAERLSVLAGGGDRIEEYVWVDGWPRQVRRAPAGTVARLPAMRTAGTWWGFLRAEAPSEADMECALMGQRADGDVRLWRSYALAGGQEIPVKLPPSAQLDDALWLLAHAEAPQSACVWYGWHEAPGDDGGWEDVIRGSRPTELDERGRELAEWLAGAVSGLDPRRAEYYAGLIMGAGPSGELSDLTVTTDSDFRSPEQDAWHTVQASTSAQFTRESDAHGEGDFIAGVRGDTEGYHGGWCQTVDVQPGKSYLYIARISANLSAGAKAIVGYWDYSLLPLGFRAHNGGSLGVSQPWMVHWQEVKVPLGVRSISICPALLSGRGQARLDWALFIPQDALR